MEQQAISNHKIQNYRACMILGCTGDSMGYKNGDWEFQQSGKIIHQQMSTMTEGKGPLKLKIDMSWRYSDDTVMHMATAQGLINSMKTKNLEEVCRAIAVEYKRCWSRMSGRAPGKTTGKSIQILEQDGSNWNKIPFRDRACGCGGSMRSACIGLRYYKDIDSLIMVSIEAGRMTHHNPIGYLGSMVSSYFTALAIQKVDVNLWAAYLFSEAFPKSKKYVEQAGREVKLNIESEFFPKFIKAWQDYVILRNLSLDIKKPKEPKFPQKYGIIEREHFYKQVSWNGWGGALGIDSVIIAYDALLGCKGSWQQFCLRGILHGGDNDSTGAIGGSWFGAYYGFQGVPDLHTKYLEDNKKISNLGDKLYEGTRE